MLGSLRFRLPALFLLGIVLAGLVASLISIRFFQSYNRARAIDELRSESAGIVRLYARQAGPRDGAAASVCRRARRRQHLLGAGVPRRDAAPGNPSSAESTVDVKAPARRRRRRRSTCVRTAGATSRSRSRSRSANNLFGALVVAKPTSQLRSRSVTLVERLGDRVRRRRRSSRACSGSISRGGSRSRCAELSRRGGRGRGRAVRGGAAERARLGRDLASLAPVRRHGDEARGVGAALAQLPDVGVARAADAADGDPRARVGAARRRDRRSGAAGGVARGDRRGGDAARAARRRRARSREARRAPLHRAAGRGRHGAAVGARVRVVRRGGAAARDRLPARRAREAGDRDRRRPRAADHREPALERVPVDARGRRGSSWSSPRPNGSVSVAVADTGPGIDATERDRIFRPFWSRDGGGTGLGLAIARELAVALGGQIDARQRARAGQPLRARAAAG